jgi:hypothetical protein
MAPIAAIIIGIFWSVVALLIAWSRGYSPRGILLCLAGLLIGGGGAGWIGAYALPDWKAIGSNQHDSVAACAAVLLGALAGLYLAERLRDHQFPSNRQVATAALGFIFGGLGALVILAFTQDTWAEKVAMFALMPATIATATLAGSAISHRLPDLK